ncbi:hypothetical protein [Streptomyces sp. NPDC102462]|uniref:hypothetical protein n=1 Tax=Streptomyces sp. NPDC102462 TaxID=3366178 RepID=UPI003810B580
MSLPVRRPGLALARSLSVLGRHDEARAVLSGALDRLPAGDPAIKADLVRERSAITAERKPRATAAAAA